jgi:hypothetical protein
MQTQKPRDCFGMKFLMRNVSFYFPDGFSFASAIGRYVKTEPAIFLLQIKVNWISRIDGIKTGSVYFPS